ncbi:MAG: SHOCT-like domain-containing protein [Anaerolineales bacterium]
MTEKNERIQILEMIESGVITAAEGARLLQALDSDDRLEETFENQDRRDANRRQGDPDSGSNPQTNDFDPLSGDVVKNVFESNIEMWKRWWVIPLWIGVGVTVAGSLLMLWAYQSTGFSFWFGCSWLPFLLGVALIAMAWGSRSARWLHLRVQQEPGEWPRTIAFSFPLPLHFAAWCMRTFGQFIPKVNEVGIDFDQLIRSFEDSTTPDTPFYIEVDEGENGEIVQIYIG